MLSIVYVDDMKLSGPTQHVAETRKALGKNIKLETPKGDEIDLDPEKDWQFTFLGCTCRRSRKVVSGTPVQYITYDFEDSLKKGLDKYEVGTNR